MKLRELIYKDEYTFSLVDDETEILEISSNTENIDKSTLLVIPNSNKIPNMEGCVEMPAAILCDSRADVPERIPCIRVENVRAAIANAYSRFYAPDYPSMKIIGITGTNGKTSTATFIKSVLSDAGYKVGFIGTGMIQIDKTDIMGSNYSMTTPDPALLYKTLRKMSDEGCEAVVMEVSSHSLALDKVAPIIFDYGIFTNMSSEHSDFHGDMESYYHAKNKLFSQCKKAVFNKDDEYCRRACAECRAEKLEAGVIWVGDIYASHIENKGFDGISYMYHGKDFIFRMRLSTAGIYNVYNSLLAATVAIDMGIRPCEVKKSFENIKVIPGRFEIMRDSVTVVIDYAHTDTAFESIMKNLREAKKPSERLTVVFGCGGERDTAKRPRMAAVAEKYADRIIVTSDNSRNEEPMDIIADIIHGFKYKVFEVIENRAEAIRHAIISEAYGGIVAIIGKGCEKYNIDKDGYHSFDEKEIIESALRERNAI